MWMLLDPSARRRSVANAPVDVAVDTGARARAAKPRASAARPSLLEYLGAAAAAPAANGAVAGVSVFLHPGRAPVGTVAVERVFDQFECASPEVHATLDEAEVRHEGEVGFLLEVSRPFTDPRGARHSRGVLFARSVRD
jgi:hypothetical protein